MKGVAVFYSSVFERSCVGYEKIQIKLCGISAGERSEKSGSLRHKMVTLLGIKYTQKFGATCILEKKIYKSLMKNTTVKRCGSFFPVFLFLLRIM